MGHSVQQLVLIIVSAQSDDVLERWAFDVLCDRSIGTDEEAVAREAKSDEDIKTELRGESALILVIFFFFLLTLFGSFTL